MIQPMLLLTHRIISHNICSLLLVVLTLEICSRESEFPHQVFQKATQDVKNKKGFTSTLVFHAHIVLKPVRSHSYFLVGLTLTSPDLAGRVILYPLQSHPTLSQNPTPPSHSSNHSNALPISLIVSPSP